MFNFNAKQLMIIYPAYHSGAYLRGCFMLHDDVADTRYKYSSNKITKFLEDLRSQHPSCVEINPTVGCPNAHMGKISLKSENLNSYGNCNYYTHIVHKEPYNWHNNEEDYPIQDAHTQKIFNSMVIINVLPDCDVHPTRAKLANNPLYRDVLYKFSRDNEIWYMKKYNIPNAYINYSSIINPDVSVLINEILRIADTLNWPIIDTNTLREYMELYHNTVLYIDK